MPPKSTTTVQVEHDSSTEETDFDSNEEGKLWDALEILDEKKGFYKVKWDGKNPKTKRPWPPSWQRKKDCTPTLVKAWKAKRRRDTKKKAGGRGRGGGGRQATNAEENSNNDEGQVVAAQVRNPRSRTKQKGTRDLRAKRTRKETTEELSDSPASAGRAPSPEVPLLTSESGQGSLVHQDLPASSTLPVGAKVGPPRGLKRKAAPAAASPRSKRIRVSPPRNSTPSDHDDEPTSPQPLPNQLQHSAILGVPETQEIEDTFSQHEVPTFAEDEYDPVSPPLSPAHKPPTPPPPTRAPGEQEFSRSSSSIVSKMKRSPVKPKVSGNQADPLKSTPPPQMPRKELRPMPMMSPSAFQPYVRPNVPSQETIEEFSSPERGPQRKKIANNHDVTVSAIEAASSQLVVDSQSQEHLQMQEMESQYLNLEPPATPSPRALSPPGAWFAVHSPVASTVLSRPASFLQVLSYRDEEIQASPDLPPTASTQQAVIDSQSQIPSLGDTNDSNLVAPIGVEESRIEESQVQVRALQTQLDEARQQRDMAREDCARYLGVVDEKSARLACAEEEVEAMQATLREFRDQGTPPFFEMLRKGLEGQMKEVDRLKDLNHILMVQNERTDDEMRRRAACEPELREKVSALEGQLGELEGANNELERQVSELRTERDALSASLQRAEYALEQYAVRNQTQEDDVTPEEVPSLPSVLESDLSSSRDGADSDDDIEDYVCEYMIGGTQWCLARFPHPGALLDHALEAHYKFGDLYHKV